MGVASDTHPELARHHQGKSATEHACMHAHTKEFLADPLRPTCFTSQGLQEVTMTSTGAKAGDPLGDVAFGILACQVLRRSRQQALDD